MLSEGFKSLGASRAVADALAAAGIQKPFPVQRLRSRDIEALAMHGNKSQAQREKALARFGAGQVDALVATDVAARGLDIDDITHVINFDAPEDRDGYVHRVGRTGRAGRTGTGITFVVPEQSENVRRIAKGLEL